MTFAKRNIPPAYWRMASELGYIYGDPEYYVRRAGSTAEEQARAIEEIEHQWMVHHPPPTAPPRCDAQHHLARCNYGLGHEGNHRNDFYRLEWW